MYESTRGNLSGQTASKAISLGMVPMGGLFVPSQMPNVAWKDLIGQDYREIAMKIFGLFLPEFPSSILERASSVYLDGRFGNKNNPAPLVDLGDFGVLELWHGPTSAFKDMALQVLPHFLSYSVENTLSGAEVIILTATSGDTGKAALEGFKNVPKTKIVVFYPEGGVSPVQEKQMLTTDGDNTYVVAVKGNFDQCQTAVKDIFASSEIRQQLSEKSKIFSSANSINWGRLLPQIVYYFWTYLEALKQGRIQEGHPLNIVVPTGNFGNILAAYYAKKMGLPLNKLICASNKNNVLAEFFESGTYNVNRPFYLTNTPSMDILISSNFERFLYEINGRDGEKITYWFNQLKETGKFSVDEVTLKNTNSIYGGWADEGEVFKTISSCFEEYNYLCDPHTAVGLKVYNDYQRKTHDKTYTVIASTASPFKFAKSVLRGIDKFKASEVNDWKALQVLVEKTGWEIPEPLKLLQTAKESQKLSTQPDKIFEAIKKFI